MGAVTNIAPELFSAVLMGVPFVVSLAPDKLGTCTAVPGHTLDRCLLLELIYR